jgi:hypothetical protein
MVNVAVRGAPIKQTFVVTVNLYKIKRKKTKSDISMKNTLVDLQKSSSFNNFEEIKIIEKIQTNS